MNIWAGFTAYWELTSKIVTCSSSFTRHQKQGPTCDFLEWHMILCVHCMLFKGPSWPSSYGCWIYNYLCNQYLSLLMLWVWISFMARCTTLCDIVCQWLATCRWFSQDPPVSSTNKADRHDIAEILLKVALSTIKQTNKHMLFKPFISYRYWKQLHI